jgi:hypothetical protein
MGAGASSPAEDGKISGGSASIGREGLGRRSGVLRVALAVAGRKEPVNPTNWQPPRAIFQEARRHYRRRGLCYCATIFRIGEQNMLDQVMTGVTHLIIGGVAANALVIFSLISVAMGGEGSHITRERRLPGDSDGELFGLLFAAGGVIGLIVAAVSGFPKDPLYLALTAGVGFVAGLVIALPRVTKLNEAYLARAIENLEEGRAKEALEDASEVARSSERLRGEANQIIEMAREMRLGQPFERQSGR